jgi:hypothetical protein
MKIELNLARVRERERNPMLSRVVRGQPNPSILKRAFGRRSTTAACRSSRAKDQCRDPLGSGSSDPANASYAIATATEDVLNSASMKVNDESDKGTVMGEGDMEILGRVPRNQWEPMTLVRTIRVH